MSEIFLDIETTGLSFRDRHIIVEIACVETNDLIATKKVFHKIRFLFLTSHDFSTSAVKLQM